MSYVDLETEEISKCPLCGSSAQLSSFHLSKVIPLSGFTIQYRFRDGSSPRLITCNNCGLTYKNFYLDGDAEQAIYDLWLKYLGKRWRDSKADAGVQEQLSTEILDYYKNITGRSPSSIIDVGAGEGGYLDYLTSYKRFSLDLNPASIERNGQRGIESILLDVCSDTWIPTQSFDLVTCFDVLEHLREPDIAIRNISKLLVPGGLFIAETGNVDSFIPKYYGPQNWWYVNIPEHKVFWRLQTLQAALKKHGIDLVKVVAVTHKNKPVITLRNLRNLFLFVLDWQENKKKFRKIFLKDHFFIIGVKAHGNRDC
jgi:2-polyprenyl-3-methyl-5-hydroxy-6-metoxy-1,4-benzoquinol methylase